MRVGKRTPAVIVWCLAILVAQAAFAKRTDDVVVMKNGDRFTGEIKRLDQGRLHFKASYMAANVELDWDKVDHLESKDEYTVSLTNGQIFAGSIEQKKDPVPEALIFYIHQAGEVAEVTPPEVVVITPQEDTVWKQLTGSVDYGFSFTSGENVAQSSLSASVNYSAPKWGIQTTGSSVVNSQTGSESSGRSTFNLLYTRSLSQKWFAGAVVDLLNSQQQDLTLRASVGGGIGRVLVRRARTGLFLLSGINYSRERYSPESGNAPQINNAEAMFRSSYRMFRFSNTQVDLDAYAYPSLSDFGRVRTGLQTSLRFEIFRNFFWKFSLYENFDSRPPVSTPRNDFGVSTSLGWKF